MEKEILQYRAGQYLKNPKITQKFKLNYLASLNTFLDDKNFQNKVTELPKLKSQVITKYEKTMEKVKKEKEDRERLKLSEARLVINKNDMEKEDSKSKKN
jgi:hypothetical protein